MPEIYERSPYFTMAEVAGHNQKDDGWIVVGGCVYNITEFVKTHPGWSIAGQTSTILAICRCLGTDCSEEWEQIHSRKAKAQLTEYFIGRLEGAEDATSPAAARQLAAGGQRVVVRMEADGMKKADYASLKLDPDTATLGKLRRLLRMVFQSRWRICAPLEAIEIWIDGTSCKEETKTLSELGLLLGDLDKLCATLAPLAKCPH
ncbi:Nitrate reductase [NADH] (NR) [Durusdinium trenchii]|uniref:Nitrate reductase [NADH] (NR) n=1 Tax=Durusdinium trenchii TaxID=1381693 RepID=A0ABP0R3B2_9DINO